MNSTPSSFSRRSFLKRSSVVAAGAAMSSFPFAVTGRAAALEKVKIGLIGCGGRGTGAVMDALGAATNVIYPGAGYHTEDVKEGARVAHPDIEVVALCDLFKDRLARARENLGKLGMHIPDAMCFDGLLGYQKLLEVKEINYVIHATPPHFRPEHVLAAVKAGKHVFLEKPGAVDAPGCRTLIEAYEVARRDGLGIACGTQRRHTKGYQETIQRIQGGEIGEIEYLRCYWNGGVIWVIEQTPGMSDLEWQLRNWNYFTWLGGDHYVEQHLHNIDIMNWVMGTHPIKAFGMGGRQARQHPIHGHIYDHFAVEYEYPNGVRMFSQARQMNHCEGKVEEAVHGTKGASNCANWLKTKDGKFWRYREREVNPYQQEHQDLIASVRAGTPINEARNLAESTLTAIMGRDSAYSGQTVEWEQIVESKRVWGPTELKFGPLPIPPVPNPGEYKVA